MMRFTVLGWMLVIAKWEALSSLSDRSKDGEVNLL